MKKGKRYLACFLSILMLVASINIATANNVSIEIDEYETEKDNYKYETQNENDITYESISEESVPLKARGIFDDWFKKTYPVYVYIQIENLTSEQRSALIRRYNMQADPPIFENVTWYTVGKIEDVEISSPTDNNKQKGSLGTDAEKNTVVNLITNGNKLERYASNGVKNSLPIGLIESWKLSVDQGAANYDTDISTLQWHLDGTINLSKTLTVKYVDENGNSIPGLNNTTISSGIFDTIYKSDIALPTINGYKPFGEPTLNGDIIGSGREITFEDGDDIIIEVPYHSVGSYQVKHEYYVKETIHANALAITFNEQCASESALFDYVELYYKKDEQVYKFGKYGVNDLAGRIINIPSSDFYLYWHTDGSGNNYYGFSIDKIEPIQLEEISGEIATLPEYAITELSGTNYPESEHNPYSNNSNQLWHYIGESGLVTRYTLENTVSEGIVSDVLKGTIIKASELNHIETNNDKEYTFKEDTGDVTIEKDTISEIILKYVREKQYRDIAFQLEWDDDNNKDGFRPDTYTVSLLEDGISTREFTKEATETSFTIHNLPTKDEKGNSIDYSFEVSPIDKYEITYDEDRDVYVATYIPKSFSVIIPKQIVLNGNTGRANYTVSASGNIYFDTLSVIPDASLTLNDKSNISNMKASISQEKTSFTNDELGTTTGTIQTERTIFPGEWRGTFHFAITLNE